MPNADNIRIDKEKRKMRHQHKHQLLMLAAIAALALIIGSGCVYPSYDGDEAALEERQSVWQYLKVYSIFHDRLPKAAGSMTPYDMFIAINDSLGSGRYTEYLDDRPGGGVLFPPDTEFEDPWPLTDSTVYFYLPEFSDTALWVFQRSLRELSRYPNIIIDVRDNGGGLLSVTNAILDKLLPTGTPYIKNRYREYNGSKYAGETLENVSRTTKQRPELPNKRIAVLMNGWSASASEILAAGLKDGADAYLVGGKSYGKGIGQVIITRDGRKRLSITFLEIRGLTERTGYYHRRGIEPDAVPDSITATPDKTIKAAYARWWGVPSSILQQWPLSSDDREIYYAFKLLEPGFTVDDGDDSDDGKDDDDVDGGEDIVDNDTGDDDGGVDDDGVVDGMGKRRSAGVAEIAAKIHRAHARAKARWRPMGAVVIDEKDLQKR